MGFPHPHPGGGAPQRLRGGLRGAAGGLGVGGGALRVGGHGETTGAQGLGLGGEKPGETPGETPGKTQVDVGKPWKIFKNDGFWEGYYC